LLSFTINVASTVLSKAGDKAPKTSPVQLLWCQLVHTENTLRPRVKPRAVLKHDYMCWFSLPSVDSCWMHSKDRALACHLEGGKGNRDWVTFKSKDLLWATDATAA
jgi:hypothetical protein